VLHEHRSAHAAAPSAQSSTAYLSLVMLQLRRPQSAGGIRTRHRMSILPHQPVSMRDLRRAVRDDRVQSSGEPLTAVNPSLNGSHGRACRLHRMAGAVRLGASPVRPSGQPAVQPAGLEKPPSKASQRPSQVAIIAGLMIARRRRRSITATAGTDTAFRFSRPMPWNLSFPEMFVRHGRTSRENHRMVRFFRP
jgi:hypothetical protein